MVCFGLTDDALKSMEKIKWNKVKTTIKKWKPGEYVRQTSIVVIGVLITFVGSELVTRYSEQKDIKSTMLLIRDELKSNRDQFEDVMSEFRRLVKAIWFCFGAFPCFFLSPECNRPVEKFDVDAEDIR